jgi:hypothetical protein
MQVLGRRPGSEAGVAAAAHPDRAVTPRLTDDPVDDVVAVRRLVLVGKDGVGAQALAARVGDDADVAMVGGVLVQRLESGRVGIDVQRQ